MFLSPIGQLLSGEGACVTFYALRPLERGDTVLGDFRASLEMTVRHVPLCSLPADWYLRPLRTLTACSARILQRMRESANLSALGNPMQNFHSLKGQRELRRASRLSADRPWMAVWAGREARNLSLFLTY